MNHLSLVILSLVTLLSLGGCRSTKSIVTVPIETKTIVKERLVEVRTPADSSWLIAYLECDSNYNVLITAIQEKASPGITSDFNQSKVDNQKTKIEYRVVRKTDTIYIPVVDTTTYKEIPIEVPVPYEVNRLTGWQYFQIWAGRIFLILLAALIAWGIIRITR